MSETAKLNCEHIYMRMNIDICPLCGKETHEVDWKFQNELHKQWHLDGKAVSGVWWSI